VQAEGVVYEVWNPTVHLLPMPQNRYVPPSWSRYLVIDFGYVDPFVCQWWAKDEDGRLFRYRELYRTGRLVEDHARQILELSRNEPRPQAVICDHDAEGVATLSKYLNLPLIPARKELMTGIQAVTARLRPAGDGRPRLFLYRDALVERDRELLDAKKPCCSEEEVEGYVWDVAGGRRKGETPVDRDNHGMDAMRYMVMHLDGGGAAKSAGFRPVGVR
jgi:phage terminase large subunit